jgi:hypothetical protein
VRRLIQGAVVVVLVAFGGGSARPEGAAASTGLSGRSRKQEALSVWQGYVRALRDGDREQAAGYWSDEAVRDSIFDWQLGAFERAGDAARIDSLGVTNVKEQPDGIRLVVRARGQEYTYYVVRKGARELLANPVEVLTAGWKEQETAHLVCRYRTGDAPTAEQIGELEQFCSELSSSLEIPLKRKIRYYKCGSTEQVGALFGRGPSSGLENEANCVAAAVAWTSFHEITHIILGQTCRKAPTSLLLEGAACYFGGTTMITRDALLCWAKTLLENGESSPIAAIANESTFWGAQSIVGSYAVGGAFAGFLIETYGVNKFKALYRYRDASEAVQAAIAGIYGKEITELEEEWGRWIRSRELPTVGLGTSPTATEIFRMDDPAGDDDGNGHYEYPLAARYQPGMFDLTGFKASADRGRIYFELTYRDLVEWDREGPWGFDGTYTRVAIDTGGWKSGGGPDTLAVVSAAGIGLPGDGGYGFGWDAHATIAGHCDYLINVSDSGVAVWHKSRIASTLLRAPRGNRLADASANRIQWSIPCDDTPQKSWRYAVAVGGCGPRMRSLGGAAGDFLVVGESPSDSTGGGGTAIGANPNFYDVLLPAGVDQRAILGDHDAAKGRLVAVPMVGQ